MSADDVLKVSDVSLNTGSRWRCMRENVAETLENQWDSPALPAGVQRIELHDILGPFSGETLS